MRAAKTRAWHVIGFAPVLLIFLLGLGGCAANGSLSVPSQDRRCAVYATALAVLEAARADHNPAQAVRIAAYRALLDRECPVPAPASAPVEDLDDMPEGITTAP